MDISRFKNSPDWALLTAAQKYQVEHAASPLQAERLFNSYVTQQKAKTTTPEPTAPEPTAPVPKTTTPTTTTTTPTPPSTSTSAALGKEAIAYKHYLDFLKTPQGSGLPAPASLRDFSNRIDYFTNLYNERKEPTGVPSGYTQEQLDNYNDYLSFLKTDAGKNWPIPESIDDFLAHMDEWAANAEYYTRGYTDEQLREFNTWRLYASKFGGLEDWYPNNIQDWIANYDKAQQQLDAWKQLATEEEQEALEAEAEREEYEEHALPPEEAARRREEAYGESRYAAQERYTETPEYQLPFTQYLQEQGRFSGALEAWTENQYPSLVSQFRTTQPELTGYATREEARAEKARREESFRAWLPKQEYGLYQEYASQRPGERGERLYMQAPTMRTANW